MTWAIDPATPTTRREDLTTALFATWLMIGLFVDGWAHNNLAELETFFTPWHGLFYSGFLATAGHVLWVVGRRRAAGRGVPVGYGVTLAGIAVFTAGGVGDGIWHTLFGIEASIDALFSPTHLLLFAGLAMIVTTPIRAFAARTGGRTHSMRPFLPVAFGSTLLVVLVMFMFQYASGFNVGAPEYAWTPEDGSDLVIAFGVLSFVLTTAVVTGTAVWLLRRWDTPAGTFTMMLGTLAVLMQGIEEFSQPVEIVVPLAGGLAMDALVAAVHPGSSAARLRAFAVAAPIVVWTIHFAVFGLVRGIGWPLEIWSGTIVWTGLAGLGAALLVGSPVSAQAATAADHHHLAGDVGRTV